MANKNDASGFNLYRTGPGGVPRIELVRAKASTIIYPGQPLKIASGVYEPVAAAGDKVRAISMGYVSAGASTPAYVLACTDPENHEWRVQTDEAFATTDIGKFLAHTATAADTVTRQARNYATSSAASPGDISDGTLWESVGIVNEIGNTAGVANVDIIVIPRHSRAVIPAA